MRTRPSPQPPNIRTPRVWHARQTRPSLRNPGDRVPGARNVRITRPITPAHGAPLSEFAGSAHLRAPISALRGWSVLSLTLRLCPRAHGVVRYSASRSPADFARVEVRRLA